VPYRSPELHSTKILSLICIFKHSNGLTC
jgi:hypothetical protein